MRLIQGYPGSWLFLIFFYWVSPLYPAKVTYNFSGGRFGDALVSYLHAKWISYKHHIPLLYRPFEGSEYLNMDLLEEQFIPFPKNLIFLGKIPESKIDPFSPFVYVCSFFPEDPVEKKQFIPPNCRDTFYFFEVDWKDLEFRKEVLRMTSPKQELSLFYPQGEGIHTAMHIREGGGFDPSIFHKTLPLKFPPIEFYAGALLDMLEQFQGKTIQCRIFTDARHPEELVQQIQKCLPIDAPIFFYYEKSNDFKTHILEDFFSLFLYDVLIRPCSNFSLVPSLIHDYMMVYTPSST